MRRVLGVARAAGLRYLRRVIVDPVRTGRLRSTGWPPGLRPIAVVGVGAWALAAVLVLLAAVLRAVVPLGDEPGTGGTGFPRALLGVVLALFAIALSLGVAGALHARAWLRWIVVSVVALALLSFALFDRGDPPVARLVAIAAAVGLVLLAAVRGPRRRRFRWIEFAIAATLVFGSIATSVAVVGAATRPYGIDPGALMLATTMGLVGLIAVPAALAAGASVAGFAVGWALWTAKVAREELGRVPVLVLLSAFALWRLIDLAIEAPGLVSDDLGRRDLLGGALLFLAIGGSWLALRVVARARGGATIEGMTSRIGPVALVVAALTTVLLPSAILRLAAAVVVGYGAPAEVGAVMTALPLGDYAVIQGVRGLGGVALLVAAVVAARRGMRTLPELFAALGWASIGIAAAAVLGYPLIWTTDTLAFLGGAAALVVGVVLLMRRRLTASAATALLAALAMSAIFAHRDVLKDPLAALLPFAGAALVLVGFVWSFLTGYSRANGDSVHYPRAARVQLVLANALFALTVLAFAALARDPDAAVDLGAFAGYGGQAFGDPLLVAGMLLAGVAAWRGIEPDAAGTAPEVPAPEVPAPERDDPTDREAEGAAPAPPRA